jgi:hypothetical protein
MREDSGDGQEARADLELEGDGKGSMKWPFVGDPPIYPPLSPWTRFQGGAFYIMLINLFSIVWTLVCAAGVYYGMRNVAIVKGLSLWEALLLRWDTGLWLWVQVWLYPILSGQLASLLIRLYHKKKGMPLPKASLIPGPRS